MNTLPLSLPTNLSMRQNTAAGVVRLILLLLLCATGFSVSAAQAQIYDEKGNLYGPDYYKKTPHKVGLSFMRIPETDSGNFLLRLAVSDVLSGCPKLSKLEHQVRYEGSVMRIHVGQYIVDMRDLPKNPHYECDQAIKSPSAEIAMSKQILEDRNIRAIEFSNDATMEMYNVIMTDRYIWLQPTSPIPPSQLFYSPQDIYRVKSPLKYWFYPERTVQLYMPGADINDPQTRQQLDKLADRYKLTPLRDMWSDFEAPLMNADFLYYVDEDGNLPDEAVKHGKPYILDEITVEKTVYGLEGDETDMVPMQVYIKTPGMYE